MPTVTGRSFSFTALGFAPALATRSLETPLPALRAGGQLQQDGGDGRHPYTESEVSAAQMMLHIKQGCAPCFQFAVNPPGGSSALHHSHANHPPALSGGWLESVQLPVV